MNYTVPSPEPGAKLPPCSEMRRLRMHEGWSYQDFMNAYGVTNQAVYKKLRRCGLAKPRADYSEELPWIIHPRDRYAPILRNLRAAARERQGILEPLSGEKARDYQLFREKLKIYNLVVGYGPYQDEQGNPRHGFYYAPRRKGVDKWLIREPRRQPAAKTPRQRRKVG